jgi:hypothetical protein
MAGARCDACATTAKILENQILKYVASLCGSGYRAKGRTFHVGSKIMPEKVTCIVKGEEYLHFDCCCITQLQVDGWRIYTREQAHDMVAAAPGSIVVEADGRTIDLIPAKRGETKYVRTRPDDSTEDNLLKVKECHASD